MNDTEEDIVRKRRQLSPEEKYQIFIEATKATDSPWVIRNDTAFKPILP
ncbi:MAG: hypothetical protein ABIL06_07050 [Pseudomonadota bacterium]